MPIDPRHFRWLTLAVSVAGLTVAARAQLAKTSPFNSADAAAAAAPAANSELQYIGWRSDADGEEFRLYDRARKAGVWLKLNERDSNLDVLVKQTDADRETVTIEHGGQTLPLTLRVSKVAAGGAPMIPIPMPQPPMPNVGPGVINSVKLNPTQADEQQRLEAVAAEVARRRALREQAQQQMNQGVMPQVTVPQVQQQQPATRQGMQQNPQGQTGPRRGRPQ
jgi:hypothetical protein